MRKSVPALALGLLLVGAATSAVASDQGDVMSVVRQFVDAFNKGDANTVAALCADQTSIIDEFPPHEWHGAGSCVRWLSDWDADAKKNVITDASVTMGEPKHVDVTADRAYVVAPADYILKVNGKPTKETGAVFTLTLQKSEARWRITGWSWAKP
jgi:ketosteroid isomerase-like protein